MKESAHAPRTRPQDALLCTARLHLTDICLCLCSPPGRDYLWTWLEADTQQIFQGSGWSPMWLLGIRFDSLLNCKTLLLHQETPGLVASFGQQAESRSGESRTGEDALGPPEKGEVRSWRRALLGHGQVAGEGIGRWGSSFPKGTESLFLVLP